MAVPANRPFRVLFLCTGNSARSQIAETILNRAGGGRFAAESAGSEPAARVNPMAIETLGRHGYAWSGHPPRGLGGLEEQSWDFVITVCDRAREACPIFPGQPVVAHWGMPDPAAAEGGEEERRRAFDDALLLIRRRLELFVSLPLDKLARLALEARVREIGDVPASGRVAGIVLAAGSSVRMGRNKLLLAIAGESVVRRVVSRALAVLDPVIVVVGHEADRVRQELAGLPCRIVLNPGHDRGIDTSVRAGVAALPTDAEAAVVLLADMPLVTPAMLAGLVERFYATRALLVISRYGDAVAPPHLYARRLFAELAERGSGKPVIDRHRAEAEVVAWPITTLADLDVPADRERVEALLDADPG